jgi:hypothetical protein
MTHTVVSVIGFSHRGVPILVGYRVPDNQMGTYGTVLEGIVNSPLRAD